MAPAAGGEADTLEALFKEMHESLPPEDKRRFNLNALLEALQPPEVSTATTAEAAQQTEANLQLQRQFFKAWRAQQEVDGMGGESKEMGCGSVYKMSRLINKNKQQRERENLLTKCGRTPEDIDAYLEEFNCNGL